jgi:ribose/xylose/arabinose/galactoside ABC-type transport system permease subunit
MRSGNRPAAVLVGIPVKRIEMIVFGLSGALGALLKARLGTPRPNRDFLEQQ